MDVVLSCNNTTTNITVIDELMEQCIAQSEIVILE